MCVYSMNGYAEKGALLINQYLSLSLNYIILIFLYYSYFLILFIIYCYYVIYHHYYVISESDKFLKFFLKFYKFLFFFI